MSRVLLAVAMLGLVAAGLQAHSLPATRSWVSERLYDAVATAREGLLANATMSDLVTEKEKLEKELCEARKGPIAPLVETERKTEPPKEAGKAVVAEQWTEKLPGNKTKEVVVTEETKQLPSNETVKKTVERQVVKGSDGKATGNETVIVKETRKDSTLSSAPVTTIVKEQKVVTSEEETEEEKKQTVTEKKEVEKAEKTEKEVETDETPEPEELPVNATIKKTSVEHKVVKKDLSKYGKPQESVIEKTTRTDTTKMTEPPTVKLVSASVLDEKAGPTKIVVTQKRVEKFAGNETKEVVVKEVAEKLPSNNTIQTTVVERKVTKDTGKDSDMAQQETLIEKEIEVQITNTTAEVKTAEVKTAEVKTAEVKAAGKDKKQEYKEKIENIKRQVQELKEQIKDEEVKTKLDGAPEACVDETKIEKSTKQPAEEKKAAPVVKVVEKVPAAAAKTEKEEKQLVLPAVKETEVEKVIQVGKVIERQPVSAKALPPVVVPEKAPEKEVVVTTVPEGKKVVHTLIPAEKVVTAVKEGKDGKAIEKHIPVATEKLPAIQTAAPVP